MRTNSVRPRMRSARVADTSSAMTTTPVRRSRPASSSTDSNGSSRAVLGSTRTLVLGMCNRRSVAVLLQSRHLRSGMSEMNDLAIVLNRLAQSIDPLEEGVAWFNELSEDGRREVLHKLRVFASQAHPTGADAELAISRSGIRPTVTPAVLLARPNLAEALGKIANLPLPELERGCRLLVLLLGIADERRRTISCADGCSHWWHHLS
jgi:uncharacterized protein DUF5958